MSHSRFPVLRGGLCHLSEYGSVRLSNQLCWILSRGQLSEPSSFWLPCYLVSRTFPSHLSSVITLPYKVMGFITGEDPPELGNSDLTQGC